MIGASAAGLAFGYAVVHGASGISDALAANSFGPTTWYSIAPDGKITVLVGKAEMGQHVSSAMAQIGGGHWASFVPGLEDGDQYLFYVAGSGTSGYKRDPRARLLTFQPAFPLANCVLRAPARSALPGLRYHHRGRPPTCAATGRGMRLSCGRRLA